MGNQKSSIDCTRISNEKAKKTKKSHSLNTLLNPNFLIRSNSSQKLRLRFAKKSKKTITTKNSTNAEYTSLNDYNTKMARSNSFQDNYISIYDDFVVDKKPKSYTLNHCNESNLYSKINVKNSNHKNAFQISYNLQPFSKLIVKLGAFTRKSKKCPIKRFDPNEEFFYNQPVQHKFRSPGFSDQSNLYTDMSESICSDLSKIKIESEDNYQSLHDQYDYISNHSRVNSLEPPPLPPASTQPCRDDAINHIFTSIPAPALNNQVYFTFSNECERRIDTVNGSLHLSTSSSSTSIGSSISNENFK